MGVRGIRRMSRDPDAKRRARELRSEMTSAEVILWNRLRNRALAGFKFRRQYPIGPYVADFACVECRVIVEADGETHVGREDQDADRTLFLECEGWLVLRFWNSQVYEECDWVLERIFDACDMRRESPSPPSPLPRKAAGEG